ncbi:MAG: bifunctional oligoribonuclease/PAP phosphatase NrnA [Treponema sp.]|jgi:phosphoesterase RecJ-like protein|nr:bifunctional oligoribonuclease/PAP phosphatase NrnA [Treponema sp.]
MVDKLINFIAKHDSFILTTHDPPDADGLGAQMVLACILKEWNKQFKIINASPTPEQFKFMDPQGMVECWNNENHWTMAEQSTLFMLDTADEEMLGQMKDVFSMAEEVFVIDHHEPKPHAPMQGIIDSSAASTCEMVVKMAESTGIKLDYQAAFAAYAGIAYDTGFFAYPKTTPGTLYAAMTLMALGAKPNEIFHRLYESSPVRSLVLQKRAIASMEFHCDNRVASQVLRQNDFVEAGALSEDTDGFVNFPLKAQEVVVSVLVKETPNKLRCSLRSKGNINVAKIAQEFGGGGHVNASAFKSNDDVDKTLAKALAKIAEALDKP